MLFFLCCLYCKIIWRADWTSTICLKRIEKPYQTHQTNQTAKRKKSNLTMHVSKENTKTNSSYYDYGGTILCKCVWIFMEMLVFHQRLDYNRIKYDTLDKPAHFWAIFFNDLSTISVLILWFTQILLMSWRHFIFVKAGDTSLKKYSSEER